MSYDFNVRMAPCDHMQSLERYVIDADDFRTLHLAANPAINMRAPINGHSLVRLFIGGNLVTPNHPVYGYDLVPDPNRVNTSDVFHKIVFRNPVRVFMPLIEVSYLTVKTFCLKCSGTGQVNDLKKANSGGLLHVTGNDKLVQRVLKFVLTSRCPFYPQFTCRIKDMVGKKFGVSVTEIDISTEIVNALNSLKTIQGAQRTVQTLNPSEMLRDISNIVTTMPDATSVSVQATVLSFGSSTPQPVNFSLTSTKSLVGQ